MSSGTGPTPSTDFANVDPYNVLRIPTNAEVKEIDAAYKRGAARLHPDRNFGVDTTEEFQLLKYCYNVLKDEKERDVYDRRRGLNLNRRIQQFRDGVQQPEQTMGSAMTSSRHFHEDEQDDYAPQHQQDDEHHQHEYEPAEVEEIDATVVFPPKITLDLTVARPPSLGGEKWGFTVNKSMTVTSVDPEQQHMSGLVPHARVIRVNNQNPSLPILLAACKAAAPSTISMRTEIKTLGTRLERRDGAVPWGFALEPKTLEVRHVVENSPAHAANVPLHHRILFINQSHVRTMNDVVAALSEAKQRRTLLILFQKKEITQTI